MDQHIGRNIRYLRQKNHMTQEQLAEAADLCVAYISKIENNHVNNISLAVACDLAEVLRVPISYLIGSPAEMELLDEEMARKFAECSDSEKKKVLKIIDIIKEDSV